MFDLEREIQAWRGALASKGALRDDELDELESHLRDGISDLASKGLESDEAFFVSAKRVGNIDSVAREYASELARSSDNELWKNLAFSPAGAESKKETWTRILATIILGALAALSAQLPFLFDLTIGTDEGSMIFLRFASFYFIPFVGAYLIITRERGRLSTMAALGIAFASYLLPAIILAFLPFAGSSQTAVLSVIHVPIALWLATMAAYCGGAIRDARRRMDFVRFTGESFLYGVLLACGLGVVTALIINLFKSIGVDIGVFARDRFIPMGLAAAGFAAPVLASAKRNVIENIAPVLARIFTPLVFAAMAIFLAFIPIKGVDPFADRNLLIGFDAMLALVVALVLFTLSARDPRKEKNFGDWMCFLLIVVALTVDCFALRAISLRIGDYGASPNKLAALGENLLFFFDLAGLAFCYAAFLLGKRGIESAVKWQTAFLLPIFAWAAFVALAFPLIFNGA